MDAGTSQVSLGPEQLPCPARRKAGPLSMTVISASRPSSGSSLPAILQPGCLLDEGASLRSISLGRQDDYPLWMVLMAPAMVCYASVMGWASECSMGTISRGLIITFYEVGGAGLILQVGTLRHRSWGGVLSQDRRTDKNSAGI